MNGQKNATQHTRKESGGEEVVTTKSVVRLGAWDTEPVDGPFLLFYN